MRELSGLRVTMLVTNDVSRDARVRKEARSLAAVGADVLVIGCGSKVAAELEKEPFKVELVCPAEPAKQPSRLARVVHNLRQGAEQDKRLEAAAIERPAHVVHANDLDTLPVGVRIAKRLGAKLLYDAHELSSEAVGLHPLVQQARVAEERRSIWHADAVITVNDFIATELSSRYRIPTPDLVYNGASSCLRAATDVHEPVRILFQGQFFADRNLEELVRAMNAVRGTAVLTLQGWGGVEQELRKIVAAEKLEKTVRFVEPVTPADVVAAAAEHDIGIINHKPLSLNHLYSSPNKLFDYMAAGLAIVASDLPFLRQVITDARCGVLHEQAGEDELARLLVSLVEQPEKISAMKRAAVAACERYCWDAQAERLVAVYKRLLQGVGDS